jgi:D-3-phosphoglycerate dehydrogenase
MSDPLDDLILDLLEWLDSTPRPYSEVLEVWRTSCPRLPVWEEANDRGFIERHPASGRGQSVSVSVAGTEHLRVSRVLRSRPGQSPHSAGAVHPDLR